MRIVAVTMQKNEDHCLEPWIRHHGYIFGFENIVVIDHASDSPYCIDILKKYRRSGVKVVALSSDAKFDNKGDYVFSEFSRLAKRNDVDFFFPIDCDELLFLKDKTCGVTASREKIEQYLKGFVGFNGRLYIKENYLRILGHPEYYWVQPYQKVFFFASACRGLDHGFHIGRSVDNDLTRDTEFIYAHFHFKPYEVNRKLSIDKLRDYVDVNDSDALKNFDGPGFHLKSHLLATKEEYRAGFVVDDAAKNVSEIDKHLNLIGIDPAFCDNDIPVAHGECSADKFIEITKDFVFLLYKVSSCAQRLEFRFGFERSALEGPPVHSSLEDIATNADSGCLWVETDLKDVFGVSEIRLIPKPLSGWTDVDRAGVIIEAGFDLGEFSEVFRCRSIGGSKVGEDGAVIFRPTIPFPGRFIRILVQATSADSLGRIEVYGEEVPQELRGALEDFAR